MSQHTLTYVLNKVLFYFAARRSAVASSFVFFEYIPAYKCFLQGLVRACFDLGRKLREETMTYDKDNGAIATNGRHYITGKLSH